MSDRAVCGYCGEILKNEAVLLHLAVEHGVFLAPLLNAPVVDECED